MLKPSWFQSSPMQALNPLLVMRLIPFNNLVLFPVRKKFGYEVTALRRMTIGRGFSGLAWVVVGGMQLILDGEHAFSITWQVLVSATGLELAYSRIDAVGWASMSPSTPVAGVSCCSRLRTQGQSRRLHGGWETGDPLSVAKMGERASSLPQLQLHGSAYSQAPQSMKGALTSFWLLAVTVENLWVLAVSASVKNAAVTNFIAATGFGVTAFQMFFCAGFAFAAALAFGLCARSYRGADHYRQA